MYPSDGGGGGGISDEIPFRFDHLGRRSGLALALGRRGGFGLSKRWRWWHRAREQADVDDTDIIGCNRLAVVLHRKYSTVNEGPR